MIYNFSTNNIEKIKQLLKDNPLDKAFLIDYAKNIPDFLDFIITHDPKISKILCFTEKRLSTKFLSTLDAYHIEQKPWSSADLRNFSFGEKRISFDHHTPIYDGDTSRIDEWRIQYGMGPLAGLSNKLYALTKSTKLKRLTDYIFFPLGLILQTLCPLLRNKIGWIEFDYKSVPCKVFFDSGPQKDQFGESPMLDQKIEAFKDKIEEQIQDKALKTGFFMITGPRHEYIGHILDLEDENRLENFCVFATSLYRPVSHQVTLRRESGFFSEGNNVSIKNEKIYSDHCLAIGAGEKDLWFYKNAADTL